MAGTLWLGLILLQFLLTLYFLATKRYSAFIAVFIYSIFTHDFTFINASYYLPSWIIEAAKPYAELVTLYFGFRWMQRLRRERYVDPIDRGAITLVIVPTLIVLLIDLVINQQLVSSLKGVRLYVLPVLLPYFMYRAGVLEKVQQRRLIYFVLTLMIVAGLYGFIQRLAFDGDVQKLWFYRFFDRFGTNPVDEYGWANYLRNNKLRVTSIFVSPITMSLMMAIPALMAITALLNSAHRMNWSQRAAFLGLLAFALFAQSLTQTRVGMIIDAIGAAAVFLMKLRKDTFLRTLLIPVGLVALTFLSLVTHTAGDESALGRLDQYRLFFDFFKMQGLGFSNSLVQTHFDAFFMSSALVYGWLCIFPLSGLILLNRHVYKAAKRMEGNMLVESVYGFSLALIYAFTFQFIAGSSPYRLYFLLLFIILAHVKSGTRESFEADRRRIIPG